MLIYIKMYNTSSINSKYTQKATTDWHINIVTQIKPQLLTLGTKQPVLCISNKRTKLCTKNNPNRFLLQWSKVRGASGNSSRWTLQNIFDGIPISGWEVLISKMADAGAGFKPNRCRRPHLSEYSVSPCMNTALVFL